MVVVVALAKRSAALVACGALCFSAGSARAHRLAVMLSPVVHTWRMRGHSWQWKLREVTVNGHAYTMLAELTDHKRKLMLSGHGVLLRFVQRGRRVSMQGVSIAGHPRVVIRYSL